MPKPILTPKTLSALSQGNFYKIITTEEYSTWKAGRRDAVALRAIRARETRIAAGLWGDVKRIGKISELRVDVGPGYRIYFTIRGTEVILLLLGGNKRTQQADIAKAQSMADMDIEEEQ